MVLFGLFLTGCSTDSGQEQVGVQEQSTPACSVLTDASAWTAFKELADRIASQGEVPRQDLDAFGSLPTVTLWRDSLAPKVPPVQRVGNWLEGLGFDLSGSVIRYSTVVQLE
jgi:ABC-type Fe3+-hydroxamate transport system substrate-binding protein